MTNAIAHSLVDVPIAATRLANSASRQRLERSAFEHLLESDVHYKSFSAATQPPSSPSNGEAQTRNDSRPQADIAASPSFAPHRVGPPESSSTAVTQTALPDAPTGAARVAVPLGQIEGKGGSVEPHIESARSSGEVQARSFAHSTVNMSVYLDEQGAHLVVQQNLASRDEEMGLAQAIKRVLARFGLKLARLKVNGNGLT